MAPTERSRLDRVAALAVLATLFAGVGVFGWLLGHVATYGALGRHHEHDTHGYMQPLEQAGALVALVGLAFAVLAVTIGRHAVARWVEDWKRSESMLPWLAAATIPAATFTVVELLEGSVAARGMDLLALGLPLQVAIGLVVLTFVRSLLTVLVRVADRVAGTLRVAARRADRRELPSITFVHAPRVAPMASNAALRAPPRPTP